MSMADAPCDNAVSAKILSPEKIAQVQIDFTWYGDPSHDDAVAVCKSHGQLRTDRDHLQSILEHAYGRPHRHVICLCGSTKFKRAYQEWNARLTLEGNIVLSVAVWSHAERLNPSEEQKAVLDAVHISKIDLADEVFVLDVGGYIGDSTRREIAHAEKTSKPVRYLSKEYPAWTEDDCRWCQENRGVQR